MKQIKFNDFISGIDEHNQELTTSFQRVLYSGWYILGEEVKKFEENFAKYLGAKYCIGVANGLEALQIALMSLGIKEGDEVITTPISAAATTLAIMAVGAKPVFIDTNDSGLINADLIEKAITKNTKAVLPVHLYGNSVDLNKIKKICKQYKLYLIEDACQAHGSCYHGKKLGILGDIGCFSFYPTKNLGAFGDAGAIITNNKKLAIICRQIRDYGQSSRYKHVRFGLNSRLDELHAAMLKVKLKYLDKDNDKRRLLAKRYIENFADQTFLQILKPVFINDANFHLFVVKVKKRNLLQKFLKAQGIPTLIHYPQIIPDQSFLKSKNIRSNLTVSRKFVKQILSLPCHPQMENEQIDYISYKIIDFFKNKI